MNIWRVLELNDLKWKHKCHLFPSNLPTMMKLRKPPIKSLFETIFTLLTRLNHIRKLNMSVGTWWEKKEEKHFMATILPVIELTLATHEIHGWPNTCLNIFVQFCKNICWGDMFLWDLDPNYLPDFKIGQIKIKEEKKINLKLKSWTNINLKKI